MLNDADRELVLQSSLLRGIPEELLAAAGRCEVLAFDAGARILTRGEPNNNVFIVLQGEMAVSLDDEEAEGVPHRLLGAGDCFGELSIIDGKATSATVTARLPSRLCAMPHDTLWGLIDRSHAVARNLLYVLSDRMRHDNRELVRVRRASQRLNELATSDVLTGLRNRRWLDSQFPVELACCAEAGRDVALLMIDVDRFKELNDSLGHAAGDVVLHNLARVLADGAPALSLIARYGGDEFAVLVPGAALAEGLALGERLRASVERLPSPVPGAERAPPVTVSVGVAAQSDVGGDFDALMRAADAALYRAKVGGRNCVSR